MRVLIADDEAIARDSLALSLSCIPEVDLVGVASNGSQAQEMIEELKPDVALLDIKMPYQSGIGVLEALQRGRFVPQVIFVTGPSRTADIELKIQLGAHGPRRLHLVVVDEA